MTKVGKEGIKWSFLSLFKRHKRQNTNSACLLQKLKPKKGKNQREQQQWGF